MHAESEKRIRESTKLIFLSKLREYLGDLPPDVSPIIERLIDHMGAGIENAYRGEVSEGDFEQGLADLLEEIEPHLEIAVVRVFMEQVMLVGTIRDHPLVRDAQDAGLVLHMRQDLGIEFPPNDSGLSQGGCLEAQYDMRPHGLNVRKGDRLQIVWDGEIIWCQDMTWGFEQLIGEINQGAWQVIPPASRMH